MKFDINEATTIETYEYDDIFNLNREPLLTRRVETKYKETNKIGLEEIFEYNNDGCRIKRIAYKYDENDVKRLICTNLYEYNDKRQKIKQRCYDEKDNLEFTTMYEYNEDGSIIKETQQNPDGKVKFIIITTYTTKGYKESKYNCLGELCSITEFVCNEKGDFLRETSYDWNKKKIYSLKYYYDAAGAPTKVIGSDENGENDYKIFYKCYRGKIVKAYYCYTG